MQTAAQALSPAFSVVPFDFESAPKIERKQEATKKEKAPKTVDKPATGENIVVAAKSRETRPREPPKEKEKKEKKRDAATAGAEEGGKMSKGGASGKAPPEDAGEPVPSMIDLRVGHIVDGMYLWPSTSADDLFHQSRSIRMQMGCTLK